MKDPSMITTTSPACDGQRDIARAIDELAERLPEPLLPLARLAYNYRWSWIPGAAALFRDIDPQIWRHSGCNPRYVIDAAPPHRLAALAAQREYGERLHDTLARVDADLNRPWAETPIVPERPVAYLCSEFGVHCSLPLYGGGLGILAGDMLKAASDLPLPTVGVGLLYEQGYFRQRMDTEGWQHEYWTTTHFEQLPMVRVTGPDGQLLTVDVVMRGRRVQTRAAERCPAEPQAAQRIGGVVSRFGDTHRPTTKRAEHTESVVWRGEPASAGLALLSRGLRAPSGGAAQTPAANVQTPNPLLFPRVPREGGWGMSFIGGLFIGPTNQSMAGPDLPMNTRLVRRPRRCPGLTFCRFQG